MVEEPELEVGGLTLALSLCAPPSFPCCLPLTMSVCSNAPLQGISELCGPDVGPGPSLVQTEEQGASPALKA